MAHIPRAEAIKRIREGLKKITGRSWRVCGNCGTAYGWIDVKAPASRAAGENPEYGNLTEDDAATLGRIFCHDRPTHYQGESISPDSREWAVACAEGRVRPATEAERHQDVGLCYVMIDEVGALAATED